MAEITTLFWDIGGVLLSNGWDPGQRRRAVEEFALDPGEFEARHEELFLAFETHNVTLHEYLDETVFYRPRGFSREEFRRFMFAQSEAHPETIEIAQGLARSHRYLMATVNNESLELNVYRIRHFGLRRCFSAFYSSCVLGVRKPSAAIYERALEFTQRAPAECLMIDDRPENLEAPGKLGMTAIRYESSAQLREELARHGVEAGNSRAEGTVF
jgi:putative hydrolase of the HAD superfamily